MLNGSHKSIRRPAVQGDIKNDLVDSQANHTSKSTFFVKMYSTLHLLDNNLPLMNNEVQLAFLWKN